MEVGPYRVKEGGKLEYNDGSWDEFANLLFVDNPVGTGFSYVDTNGYLKELQEMADNMVVFLEKWFSIFPEYENDEVRQEVRSFRRITSAKQTRFTSRASHTQGNIFPTSLRRSLTCVE